jgi:prevent-host-death family protein
MHWKLADAKQQLSRVVRLAKDEPQILQNRQEPVAVVVNLEDFERFRQWQQRNEKTLAEAFADLRQIAEDEGWETPLPPHRDRPNAFLETVAARPTAKRSAGERRVPGAGKQRGVS